MLIEGTHNEVNELEKFPPSLPPVLPSFCYCPWLLNSWIVSRERMKISVYWTDKFCVPWLHYQKWITRMLNEWKNECFSTFWTALSLGFLSIKEKVQGKGTPLQVWTGPEGYRSLRLPDFKTVGYEGGKVVSPTHRPPFPPRKCSRYSFLLEVESTPGP